MLRKVMTGVAALSVLALGATACSSSNNSAGSSSSTPASSASSASSAASSAAASSATSAASSSAAAPSSESSSMAASSSSSAAESSSGGASSSAAPAGDPHGGVALVAAPPNATTQGTKAITVENNPIPSLEDNFNAFNGNGFGYKLNIEGLFYETPLVFNNLKANTVYAGLATDFAWNADGTQLTLTLRDGVKFSDGSPLTPDDVAYTYQVMKDVPATNRSGLPVDNAKVVGTNKVTITFTQPQYQNLYNIAGQTFIVKKSIYSARGRTRRSSPTPTRSAPAPTR